MSCARGRSRSGCARDEALELGDELGVAAEGEVGVDPLLEHDRAELLEPRDLVLRERLVQEVGERGAAPERESVAERALGELGAAGVQCGAAVIAQPLEAVDVDPVALELERIAGRARRDDRPERLAELRHVHLHGVRGRLRRLARPQILDQSVH